LASKNVLELSDQQSQAYAEKKDLKITPNIQTTIDNFLLLKRKNYGFSLSKKVGDFLKNKLS
jgi:NOL1/NOP2/fmu family ribosome biogenesis protein